MVIEKMYLFPFLKSLFTIQQVFSEEVISERFISEGNNTFLLRCLETMAQLTRGAWHTLMSTMKDE